MSLKYFVSVIPQEKVQTIHCFGMLHQLLLSEFVGIFIGLFPGRECCSFRYEIDENGPSRASIPAKEILFRLRNSTVTYMYNRTKRPLARYSQREPARTLLPT